MRIFPLLALAAVLGGCGGDGRLEIQTGEAMGTTYRIKTVGRAGAAMPEILSMLDDLDRDLSTWRDDSWVMEFNRAPAGVEMEMPASVAELMGLSMRYHIQSEGRFDPAIGALIRLWGFGAWRNGWEGEPTDEELQAARRASGIDKLRIQDGRIRKQHDGVMLDFSGIAKGHAVDRMGELLREAGIGDFLIEFGGDVLASGNAPGKSGWTVAGPALDVPLTLHNEAIATSGSDFNSRGGHSHVIDPRSGRPVPVGAPAFARATTCAEADAMATAEFVGFLTGE